MFWESLLIMVCKKDGYRIKYMLIGIYLVLYVLVIKGNRVYLFLRSFIGKDKIEIKRGIWFSVWL